MEAPVPLFYELDDHEDDVFSRTIELAVKSFTYARYTPMLYFKGKLDQLEQQSQQNMGKFMKILLVKRLESSFHAFRNSIGRFIHSYEQFIEEYDKRQCLREQEARRQNLRTLENDDDEAVQRLIDEGKAQKARHPISGKISGPTCRNDLGILKEIQEMWSSVTRDPKLLCFLEELAGNRVLKKNKLIIFTESKETAEYLAGHIDSQHGRRGALLSSALPAKL